MSLLPRDAWRIAGFSIISLLVLTFVLYQQTVLYLIGIWNQLEIGNYGHGYLVLAISGYLIFDNRRRLLNLTPCPEYRAIVAVVFAAMLWMVAALVDIAVLQTVALLLLVLSIVWVLLGTRVTRLLVFPVLFIGFAIPIWFPLSPILQDLTADAVFWIIRIIEIPALRVDNMIVVPAGKFSIEEACSGLRYFLAALTLGMLYAYLNYVTFRSRLVVVLVSVGAAMLANVLRVFIVVYLGYTTDMQHPFVHDHLALGWYLFGGLIIVLLVIDTWLQRTRQHDANGTLAVAETTALKPGPCNKSKSQFFALILASAVFISVGPGIIFWISTQSRPDSYLVPVRLPLSSGEWSAMDDIEDDWSPQYHGAIDHKVVFHDKNNHEVHLYLGVYATQRQGEELINDLNKISDIKIWHIRYQRAKLYNIDGQQQQVLEQLLEKDDGMQRLVWYWYHVAEQDTVNKYEAKALQVLGLLKGKRQAAVVAVATKLDDDPEHARKILTRFVKDMAASIGDVIDDTQ